MNFGHTFAHAIEMATEFLFTKECYRHGEAVGLGILCELKYSNKKKNKIFKDTIHLLEEYKLPIKLDMKIFNNKKQILLNTIYKNIFLDKKKISRYPRYISLKKIYQPKIKELDNNDLILQTINNLLK